VTTALTKPDEPEPLKCTLRLQAGDARQLRHALRQ
jgi:hypothetical protein